MIKCPNQEGDRFTDKSTRKRSLNIAKYYLFCRLQSFQGNL